MNDTANVTLLLGASPVMAHAPEEVEELVALAGALVLNPGTLERDWVEVMLRAGVRARALSIPVVLDPVGPAPRASAPRPTACCSSACARRSCAATRGRSARSRAREVRARSGQRRRPGRRGGRRVRSGARLAGRRGITAAGITSRRSAILRRGQRTRLAHRVDRYGLHGHDGDRGVRRRRARRPGRGDRGPGRVRTGGRARRGTLERSGIVQGRAVRRAARHDSGDPGRRGAHRGPLGGAP